MLGSVDDMDNLLGASDGDSEKGVAVGSLDRPNGSVEGDKLSSQGIFDGRSDGTSVESGKCIDGITDGGSNSETVGVVDGSSDLTLDSLIVVRCLINSDL